jgi:signal transduction histidine kinase
MEPEMEKRLAEAQGSQTILPMVTALFVDGLGADRNAIRYGDYWLSRSLAKTRKNRIFRLPLTNNETEILNFDAEPTKEKINEQQRTARQSKHGSAHHHLVVRTLVHGLSRHFNNLLMGIWGNATLIRLKFNEDSPPHCRIMKIERLIQSGGFLIHMVLGYLAEQRLAEKSIWLSQLLAQINSETSSSDQNEVPWDFEERLKWASRVQHPSTIASSMARVLEVLLMSIQSHCKEIVIEESRDAFILEKLEAINALVLRGLEINRQLRLYSGNFKPRMQKIRLAVLIKRSITQLQDSQPEKKIIYHVTPGLPMVRGEREQIGWVFQQILSNALDAISSEGLVEISVRALQQEEPRDRCVLQKGSDYVVITIKDNGRGMSAQQQRRIFEPFYAYPPKHGRLGLGLSAADGILKNYNGYIQVQSKPMVGSIFKIFLPIAEVSARAGN